VRGITPSQFGENVRWRVGVVEDRNDPQQRGRMRVRIFGVHTDDTSLIPTDSLPWAIPIQGVGSAALGGVGDSPTGIMEGSMVLVTFLDGNDMQVPAVIGSIGPIEGLMGRSDANNSGSSTDSSGTDSGGQVTPNGIQDQVNGVPGNVVFNTAEPPWFSIGKNEVGTHEFNGGQSNPRILEYLRTTGPFNSDQVPWCSGFAMWCMKQAGVAVSGISTARSWASSPSMEKLVTPLKGCVVVKAGSPAPRGHVFFLDRVQGGHVVGLGGNQNDKVSIVGLGLLNQVEGFYWPKGFAKEPYAAIS
jgi:uncharacterized protein (TIGR02594 family)